MKKKKVIIAIIIATLLLAGLLFYWNNNEVHACEAVSLEEAREILTEENVLLEYSGIKDFEEEVTQLTQRKELVIAGNITQISLVICNNGDVYYCAFRYPLETLLWGNPFDYFHRYDESIWEKLGRNVTSIYYLGKLSTFELFNYRLGLFGCNEERLYEEKNRNSSYLDLIHMMDVPDGGIVTEENIDETTNSRNYEGEMLIYFSQHQNALVQDFLNLTMYRCYYFEREDDEIYQRNLHYKSYEYRGIIEDETAVEICKKIHNSWFFEQYARMALTEMYTLKNPIVEEEKRFVFDGTISEDAVVLPLNNRDQILAVDDSNGMYYCIHGTTHYISQRQSENDMVVDVLSNLEIERFLAIGNNLVCMTDWVEKMSYLYGDGEVRVLLEDYAMEMVQEYESELYCSNYSSLIRLSLDGTIETLWEYAVYGFTVDENYIYIFDGNTWQVLDRESGEDLGWISTNIHFNYEPGEVYASGGRLFFNAWNPEEQTVSVNSLDMEGNLEQIRTSHHAFEGDLECVTAYDDYLYYATGNGSVIVRINVRTGEERLIPMAEYVIYINDVLIVEDCLLVYGSVQNWNAYLVCFDLETLEYEGMVCLE